MELRRRNLPVPGQTYGEVPYYELKDGKTKRAVEALGFRHWLLLLCCFGIIYGGVVYLHRKMPSVIEADNFQEFSEARARVFLKSLSGLGPRPSGSENLEVKAFNIVTASLDTIRKTFEQVGTNRFELDVQRPTGCFDLKFLSSFTLCYHKVTNIVVRIGPKQPSDHALMLNCHFDTMPDTPGATDDAVSCAILMDVLRVFSHSKKVLQHDIVFLFNGAEENFLQGAHGFIEQHPWRHTIRAFLNLEGTGSGGREILFQAGPGNSWLLQTYLEAAPHPFCSVLAQEIFQSGIIPSDTDFRIFRDYGRISGLDIAYTKNGWVYHTEFDEEWRIESGAIQRAGDNVLAVTKAILKSPYLAQPATFDEANKWVFYDVVGLFTVYYSVTTGQFLNYGGCLLVLLLVLYRTKRGYYSFYDMRQAFYHHLVALWAMAATMLAIMVAVTILDLVMCWYKMPELVGLLYVLPVLTAGIVVHSYYADNNKMHNAEMTQYDSILVSFAAILGLMTYFNLASSFFVFNYLLFPLLKDPLIYLLGALGAVKRVTPKVLLYSQLFCFIPVIVFAVYAISQCVDFFVPVMGRLGDAVNPEFVMGPIGLVIASSLVLFVNNLFYISRRMNYVARMFIAIFIFFVVVLLTTRLGVPYEYSHENPRLRRIIALHTNRTIYDYDGQIVQKDNALFVQSLDYRNTIDLPSHSFLQSNTVPNCTGIVDEYCRLPYYTAIHELFPPSKSFWVPVPNHAIIPYPIDLKLVEKVPVGNNYLNVSFELRGGYDKMSLHVTPLSGYTFAKWSFTDIDLDEFGRRTTYFVFLTYGAEKPDVRRFWILLENESGIPGDPSVTRNVEMAVASHHAHGKHQDSDTIKQLRQVIAARRKTPGASVNWWKWGITMIGGVSEIVVHTF
ncbi:unnamed protein product [Auanema sp. JU1783]|nr:unnamed protein product [Auanema sp. JU1783]